MSDQVILPFELKSTKARELLLEIIADSSRVAFSKHAYERMDERQITDIQIFCCLRYGHIVEGPYIDIKGCWAMKLEQVSAGDVIRVAVAFDKVNSKLGIVVITLF